MRPKRSCGKLMCRKSSAAVIETNEKRIEIFFGSNKSNVERKRGGESQ